MHTGKQYYFDAYREGLLKSHVTQALLKWFEYQCGYSDTNPILDIKQTEIAKLLGCKQPAISKGLKALQKANIIYRTKDGKYCLYEYFAHKGGYSDQRIQYARRIKENLPKIQPLLQ